MSLLFPLESGALPSWLPVCCPPDPLGGHWGRVQAQLQWAGDPSRGTSVLSGSSPRAGLGPCAPQRLPRLGRASFQDSRRGFPVHQSNPVGGSPGPGGRPECSLSEWLLHTPVFSLVTDQHARCSRGSRPSRPVKAGVSESAAFPSPHCLMIRLEFVPYCFFFFFRIPQCC